MIIGMKGAAAQQSIFEYIKMFYNRQRRDLAMAA